MTAKLLTGLILILTVSIKTSADTKFKKPQYRMGKIQGLVVAKKIVERPRPDLPPIGKIAESLQRCFIFDNFMVVEVDQGDPEANTLSIVHFAAKDRSPPCDADTTESGLEIGQEQTQILGKVGDFLVLDSPPTNSPTQPLHFVNISSGKTILTVNYHKKSPLLASLSESVSLDYIGELKFNCSPDQSVEKCRTLFLKENNISQNSKLNWDGCKDLNPKVKNGSAPSQIKVLTRMIVKDLNNPKPTLLKGAKILCLPSISAEPAKK